MKQVTAHLYASEKQKGSCPYHTERLCLEGLLFRTTSSKSHDARKFLAIVVEKKFPSFKEIFFNIYISEKPFHACKGT